MKPKLHQDRSRITANPQESGLFDYEALRSSDLYSVGGPLLYLDQVLPQIYPASYPEPQYHSETSSPDLIPQENAPYEPVILPKPLEEEEERFISLQSWEGSVMSVGTDSFFARLRDKSHNGPEQEAEVPIEETSFRDRRLIEPGAVFYWDIGYSEDRTGQRSRLSLIRFRRLPAWTRKELEKVRRQAEELGAELGWE